MAHDPTIAARVPPILRTRLIERATDEGISLSVLVNRLLRAGLDLPLPPRPPDGPLVKAVESLFEDLHGDREEFRRFAALELARLGEQGGNQAVAAIRELLALGDRLFGDADTAWEELAARLRTPMPYNPSEETNP